MAHEIQAQPIPLPASLVTAAKISYEDFLASYDGTWAEWVDGEVMIMSPASKRHQLLADFLTALLRCFAEMNGLGTVLSAPFQMKLAANLPGREPDILFVAQEHLDRLQDTYLNGPADLAVEIISPDSLVRDRGDKFFEYEQGGVREYWLLDPARRLAEFYQLDGGTYRLAPIEDGIYRSAVFPSLWLRLEWLWQEPMPPLIQILREWGLIAR